eukprot:XP_013981233.1 PREDICTED: two pore calcium channel protein 2-like [Salmo salar]
MHFWLEPKASQSSSGFIPREAFQRLFDELDKDRIKQTINCFFILYYLLEMALKVVAFVWTGYVSYGSNVFDGSLTVLSLGLPISIFATYRLPFSYCTTADPRIMTMIVNKTLQCGSYEQLGCWSNNFYDFAVSITQLEFVVPAPALPPWCSRATSSPALRIPATITHTCLPPSRNPEKNMEWEFYFKNLSRGLNVVIFVILALAFIARPSSLSVTSGLCSKHTLWEPPCGLTKGIEIICLLIFTFHLIVKRFLIRHEEFLKCKWLVGYMVVISVSVTDWTLTLNMACDDNPEKNMEWEFYFKNLSRSLTSLLVLLTTANNPDAYTLNRVFSVFFILFSGFGVTP